MSSHSTPAKHPADSAETAVQLTREHVQALAQRAGFQAAGLVALPYAEATRDSGRFTQWIAAGRAGSMHYLERAAEDGRMVRTQTDVPFPWARSAVVCFASYQSPQPRSVDPAPEGSGWIARYAWSSRVDAQGIRRPSDYHKVLLKRLKVLDERLHTEFGAFESRAYVDTGPLVERSLAVAAGLGWTGKNTCLIHPRLGSYGFLAVLLTSLEVGESASQRAGNPANLAALTDSKEEADSLGGLIAGHGFSRAEQAGKNSGAVAPASHSFKLPDRCGSCTRCLDVCPTDALIAPYQMDATRCIAYLTIEHKAPIAEEFAAGMGRQVFGCDICQDVCPWNRKAPISADPELEARPELVNPTLEWLGSLDEQAFERTFNGSPVRRAGFAGLRRNVAIAMGNSGQQRFLTQLEEWAEAADEGVRQAACWALAKLRSETAKNE